MKCENCNNNHDSKFGSGRFCSQKCASSFSTKNKRKEINQRVSKTLKKDEIILICPECTNEFINKSRKSNRKFCSKKCANIHSNKILNRKIKDNPDWWSNIQKKSYTNGNNYVAGGTTKWYQYKNIKVQGTYELRTCKILDNWLKNNLIKNWEYTNDKIEYIGEDNKSHSYLLDFKVWNLDGSFYYIETKGYKTEKDELKWKAVREKGLNLKIWFLSDIEINEGVV